MHATLDRIFDLIGSKRNTEAIHAIGHDRLIQWRSKRRSTVYAGTVKPPTELICTLPIALQYPFTLCSRATVHIDVQTFRHQSSGALSSFELALQHICTESCMHKIVPRNHTIMHSKGVKAETNVDGCAVCSTGMSTTFSLRYISRQLE